MNKKTYLNALEKVECRDEFRRKVENILSEDSREYADSVSHVEIAHPRKFRRVFTGALACVTVLSIIGVSYKMLENVLDIPDEKTISESSSILQSDSNNADLIQSNLPFSDFVKFGYNFVYFDITDDERQKLGEFFNNYEWIETDDDSWKNENSDETTSTFQFNVLDGDNPNNVIEFSSKGFMIYVYQERVGDNDYYKTKQYKIDYNYFKDEVFKILNISEVKDFLILDNKSKVSEISLNGTLLEGKDYEALVAWLSLYPKFFAEINNIPDLSTANIVNEIEYTDTDGVSHKITGYDNEYADVDGKYYRTNALDFTMDFITEFYDDYQDGSIVVGSRD